jgi:uncharacterized protein YndB with AHSA1/START domain
VWGRFRIHADREHVAAGEYLEVEPPLRLVMSWRWETDTQLPPGSSVVEITLAPHGAGTLLCLRHTGLPSSGQRASHTQGWKNYTGKLRALWK